MHATRLIAAVLSCAVAVIVGHPRHVEAQVSPLGGTVPLWGAGTRGSDIAFDSTNKVYLAVSAHGTLRGGFISEDGVPLGGAFVIQSSGNFTQFPRVAYSPDAGAFLVTWHEGITAGGNHVYSRLVTYSAAGPVLGTQTLLRASDSWWEAGPAVAYSSTSKEFLVVWQTTSYDVRGARVATNGLLIGTSFNVVAGTDFGERDPNVAYNPLSDEFYVVYSGWRGDIAFVRGLRVKAGTGAVLGTPLTIYESPATYITDVAYDPASNRFLTAWYTPGVMYGRLVNADGTAGGSVFPMSTRFMAYDALRLAHNSITGTFYFISHDQLSQENGGAEVDNTAKPLSSGGRITESGGRGNFYPRLAAHSSRGEWTLTTARDFAATMMQRFKSDTRLGGPPPPPASKPQMAIDAPGHGSTHFGSLTVAGWALDLASTTNNGVDAIHVWAYPTNGSAPLFFGMGATGSARPDVAAVYGTRYAHSGYFVSGSLPTGAYDLAVFARSTVTGTFNNAQSVRINMRTSVPRMALDTPANGATLATTFGVAGWALDLGSPDAVGVDAVHVWAFPVTGGAPTFVGASHLGGSRPDVGGVFGSRFTNSGWAIVGSLGVGDYSLVAFARSSVSGQFNNAVSVNISVR